MGLSKSHLALTFAPNPMHLWSILRTTAASALMRAAAVGGGGSEMVVHALHLWCIGSATIYWASLLHRGGAHVGSRSRPTFHIAVIGDGAPPTGMPYTVLVDDILKGVASMPGPESQT